ncbi:MAG: hypothetical protein LZF62_480223 [Nitrospira sp.]|nr:MAG: hypothetical protein LZF62_480223 [Nitrospira sp.]
MKRSKFSEEQIVYDLRHTFASRLAMRGANDRTLMALGGWKSPAMLSRYAHLSPAHLWQAVEGLTQSSTVTKTVTEPQVESEEAAKLLKDMVSRLGFEPRTLALKGPFEHAQYHYLSMTSEEFAKSVEVNRSNDISITCTIIPSHFSGSTVSIVCSELRSKFSPTSGFLHTPTRCL